MYRVINCCNVSKVLSGCRNQVSSKSTSILDNLTNAQNCLISARGCRTAYRKFIKKPLWAKIAYSKLGTVRTRKPLDKEVGKEFVTRTNIYYTMMRAVRAEFLLDSQENGMSRQTGEEETVPVLDAARLDSIKQITAEWNKKSAEIRESFEEEIRKEQEIKFQSLLKEIEEAKAEREETAKRHMDQLMEERLSFVDVTRLDDIIEESLNKKLVFNFYIDKVGRRFYEELDGSITERDESGNPVLFDQVEGRSDSANSELETLCEQEILMENAQLTEQHH